MTVDILRGKPSGISRLAFDRQIIENKNMTIADGTIIIKRSWRERIFSRPWRPLQRTREIIRFIPDPHIYLIRGKNMIVAHPTTAIKLRQEIQKREEEK